MNVVFGKRALVSAIISVLGSGASQVSIAANNIEIVSGSSQSNITGSPFFSSTDNSAQLGIDDIISIWNGSVGTAVSVSTAELGTNSQAGDITFSANLYNYGFTRKSLTLNAHNNININGTIIGGSYYNGGIELLLNPDSDVLNGGAVYLNGLMSGNLDTTVNGELFINDSGTYSLDYSQSSLTVGSINVATGGSFNFTSGLLNLTNSGMVAGVTGLLGNNVSLYGKQLVLSNNNILTIDSGASVSVNGGNLEVGSISNNGVFNFASGRLSLTNSGLTIGNAGLIGSSVALSGSRSLNISGDVIVEDAASLSVTNDSYPYGQNRFQSNLNNSGTVVIGTQGNLTVDGVINNDGSTASLTVDDDAVLSAGGISNINGGSFTFNSGQLNLTNSDLMVGATGLLGSNVIISPTRNLSVSGEIAINNLSTLSLYGGTLSAGSINNNNGGNFNYSSGKLVLTNTGLTVGASGLLGDNVELSGTRYMTVAGDVSVEAAANLVIGNSVSGSKTYFQSNLLNAGTVSVDNSLASPAGRLTVGGVITNDGAGANLNLDGGTIKAGSISNVNGGSLNFNSGSLYLTNSGMTVGVGGLLGDNVTLSSGRYLSVAGDVSVDAGASLAVATSTAFLGNLNNAGSVNLTQQNAGGLIVKGAVTNDGAGASLTIDGGSLTAGSISNVNGGSFNFNTGTLRLIASGLTVGSTGLLGDVVALTANRNVYLTGSSAADRLLTVDAGASLTLDGGRLQVGDINNNGSFDLISGNLTLTDSNLTVGSGGLLGNTVTLGAGMGVSVQSGNGLVVDAGGSFTLNGGSLSVSSITNNGSFIYNSGDLLSSGDLSIGGNSAYSIDQGSSFRLGKGGVLSVDAGTTLALNGGQLTAGAINGTFDFNSGSLWLSDSNLVIGNSGLLGNNVTLDATKNLNLKYYVNGSIDNSIDIASGATLTLDGGRLTAGTISNAGSFNFNAGSLTLTNSGMTVGAGGLLGGSVNLDSSKNLSIDRILTVDSGSTMSLNGGSLSIGNAVNNGNFYFNSGSLSAGSMVVGAGGLLGNSVTLNNSRSLSVGSLTVDSGATININGGWLSLGGVLNNGNFNFNSGGLALRSLTIGTGGLLGDTVALTSTRGLSVSGTVNVDSAAVLTVSSGYMNFDRLNNNGTVNIAGGTLRIDDYYGGTVENNGNVTIASAAEIFVGGPSYQQNAGRTNIQSGGVLNIIDADGSTYTQNAGVTTVNGELNASTVVINGGTLNGAGVINGNLEIWSGTLNPGNSPGTMEVTGDFVLTEAGTLRLEVADNGLGDGGFLWDELIVGGGFDLQGGFVQIALSVDVDINTFNTSFVMGDFFRSGTGSLNTGLDSLELSLFNNLDLYVFDDGVAPQWYSLAFSETGVFTSTVSAPPVPVPAAVWLFGSGLIALMGLARRKAA